MKLFDNFYNMKVGIVDLATSSSETVSLNKEMAAGKTGGSAINENLFKKYEEDAPLVIGVGPLTGSFAPASCLAVATFSSPRFGENLCHIPLMMHTGPGMKFSGIDFLVIRGIASSPTLLNIERGRVRILSAEDLVGVDIPESVRLLKREMTHCRSILLPGPAAENGVHCASLSTGLSGSLDKGGLALSMASKNLKGIIFCGTGGLAFNEGNRDYNETIEKRLFPGKEHKNEGFLSMLDVIGIENDLRNIVKKATWHNMACYHCPSPCMSSVGFKWRDPGNNSRVEDTLFLSDHLGFLALAKKGGADAFPLSKSCHRFGLDPAAVADTLPERGSLAESLDTVEKISTAREKTEIDGTPVSIGDVPAETHALFGGGIPPIAPGELWEERVRLSMILGICPIFLLRFPQISQRDLLQFLTGNEADLQLLEQEIDSIAEK